MTKEQLRTSVAGLLTARFGEQSQPLVDYILTLYDFDWLIQNAIAQGWDAEEVARDIFETVGCSAEAA